MCSCTSCTARALGCRVGRLLRLLLGVRGLCAPRLGRKTTGMRVVLLLLGPGSGSSRSSLHCSPPSGLALLADSVSLSGVALAGSALPQSTSSSWPSFSSAWVAVAVASFAVGCGVFSASSVLPPLCRLTLAFGFVLAFRVFPAWPAVAGLPVLAFIFRRMRRAFVRRPLISCGNRIM